MSDPHAVFARAQAAIEQGDWEAFFACFDRTELLVIAGNSVKFLAAALHDAGSPVRALFAAHAFPLETLEARGRDIVQSAQTIRTHLPPAEMLQHSHRHRELVDRYRETLESGLKAVPDLPAFTAALERTMRATAGGGSVSSHLFVGETLTDLVIQGKTARGKRRLPAGSTEDITFVQKKTGWSIRLPKRLG